MFSSLSVSRGKFRLVRVLLLLMLAATAALAAESGFSPQTRIGFRVGDQWEPAIAADGFGHVYVLYPQYGTVPDCHSCPLPSLILVVSDDNGASWQTPRQIGPPASGQFDAQILVDPVDRRTVYAAWIQNHETDTIVAKSVDFGQSWSLVIAARNADTDKPILAVRGPDVYVAFNHARHMWVAASHDGGITFSSSLASNTKLSWSLPGGGTVDPAGNVHFAWAGYTPAAGKRIVSLYSSKSSDGGKNWATTLMDVSAAPPDCSAQHCGWSYLGAQITVTSDAAGTLYALWNSGPADKYPQRIFFASSTTAGSTWSPKINVSSAPPWVEHAFPAMVAGSAGDVRIAWMDSRSTPLWNTYYRSSTNGGASWSPEARISSFVPGFTYIQSNGFNFPFGDYFGIAIDSQGRTQAAWGEGFNFKSPGSIWHSSGR